MKIANLNIFLSLITVVVAFLYHAYHKSLKSFNRKKFLLAAAAGLGIWACISLIVILITSDDSDLGVFKNYKEVLYLGVIGIIYTVWESLQDCFKIEEESDI